MKNINILTIHNEPNYGALLQAYALYHVIEELGYHPRIIDLHMQFRSHKYSLFNKIILKVYNHLKGYDNCYKIAERFCHQHEPNQVGPFYTYDQLKKYNWDPTDMYIIGSDQVWNTEITLSLKDAYTLKFLPDNCLNRYSYASSFGNIKDEASRYNLLDISNSMSKFKHIGIREVFGKDYLSKYGIDSTLVVDPTLLIDDYSHFIKVKPAPSGNILYLTLGKADNMDAFVTSISEKYSIPIELRYGYLQPSRDSNKCWLSVEDWLSRISCARLVITDSFHAMVFSILLERQFYVYISVPEKAFRISNLLEMLGLEDRIVTEDDKIDINRPINYKTVKDKLLKLRKNSMEFLKYILEDYENSNM